MSSIFTLLNDFLFRWAMQLTLSVVIFVAHVSISIAGPITPVLENTLPAFLSFDTAIGVLGYKYGVDPSYPSLTAVGNIDESGFVWTVSGSNYNGLSLFLSASGAYDSTNHSTSWVGTGSYDGQSWTMEGISQWISSTDFQVSDSLSIGGTLITYTSDTVGNPSWDSGTFTDPTSKITYKEISSSHWYNPFSWWTVDGLDVEITTDGKIANDTYTVTKGGTTVGGGGIKVGPVAAGGGFITFNGGTYSKVVQITPILEPSSSILLLVGLISLFGQISRWKQIK
ncbi:hypothetical protein [Sulfurirhabdus autotrophica]|uniref:Putative secreted protein with PEP-CTERM sorting signal n=1 Tax=Sulfurirhabdus autotrophica TaxID=1706046 RepID=A0A4R3Y8F8_9PROT|nr:hypothetical protein [Sulfurirhabdus autotrophica]TCV88130.1 putative secreted protein with PEP-CTERM sorting signal [Sulfurirhabdus autotrophica]